MKITEEKKKKNEGVYEDAFFWYASEMTMWDVWAAFVDIWVL